MQCRRADRHGQSPAASSRSSPRRPVSSGHRVHGHSNRTASPAGWISTIRRRSNRWMTASRRTACRSRLAGAARAHLGSRRGPEPALRPRRGHRRARGIALPPLSVPRRGRRFGRELNASDDRDALRPVKISRSEASGPSSGRRWQAPRTVSRRASPRSGAESQSHRKLGALLRSDRHERPRLGYRDVASATNRLTLIARCCRRIACPTHTVFCLCQPVAGRAATPALRSLQ